MPINKPKGTEDLIGADAILWSYMRETAEQVFTTYGYLPVEIPMFEQADVFVHGLGTATDVVRKEMFTVLSPDGYAKVSEGRAADLKADQRLALRPEGTAGTVRALVEHNLVPQGGAPAKLWYAGSCSAPSARRRAACASSTRSAPSAWAPPTPPPTPR